MRFEGEYTLEVPREKVWAYISNPNSIPEYVSNVERLEIHSADKFNVAVRVGVGSIKGTFDMKFEVAEMIPLQHTRMKASGSGLRSNVEFTATVDLLEVSEGKTTMKWAAEANVGGLIAGVGQRLQRMVAEKMISDMFERLKNQLEE